MTQSFARPCHILRRDPDETEGRRLYRARADAEARRQLAYERHKVRLAQAIEAQRAETVKQGSVEDESAVANGDAPK